MGLLSGPVFAQENEKWHVNYVLAKDAIAKGNYSTAIQHLTWAIAKEGRPARSTRYVGVQRGEYLPYYYLGLAYFKLGEGAAVKAAADSAATAKPAAAGTAPPSARTAPHAAIAAPAAAAKAPPKRSVVPVQTRKPKADAHDSDFEEF